MRCLIAVFVAAMVFATPASASIVLLPSDHTAGGAEPSLGLTWLHVDANPWLVTGLPGCVSTILTDPIGFCNNNPASGILAHLWQTYTGRPFVTELVCNTSSVITGTSTYTLQLAYRNEVGTSLTIFSGSLTFDASTLPGASQTLAINARPTVADGFFVIALDNVVQDAGDSAVTVRVACTVN
jgi:hypothetical protein